MNTDNLEEFNVNTANLEEDNTSTEHRIRVTNAYYEELEKEYNKRIKSEKYSQEKFASIFSENLKKYMKKSNLTLAATARLINTTSSTLKDIVYGRYYPKMSYIVKLAAVFNCHPFDLMLNLTSDQRLALKLNENSRDIVSSYLSDSSKTSALNTLANLVDGDKENFDKLINLLNEKSGFSKALIALLTQDDVHIAIQGGNYYI